jgi:hypothetical protein
MSLQLERAAAGRRLQLPITPLPPICRGQCEHSHVWWHMCGPIGPPPWEGGDISCHQCWIWPLMVSLEPAWKAASIDTSNTLTKDPWGCQNYIWLNQRYLWPPKSDTAAKVGHGRWSRTRPPKSDTAAKVWTRPPKSDTAAEVGHGRWSRTRPPKSDMAAEVGHGGRSRTRPPKSTTAADSLLETAMTRRIYRNPNTLIRGPWGRQHHFDSHTPPPLSHQIDWSNRAAAVRYCGDL